MKNQDEKKHSAHQTTDKNTKTSDTKGKAVETKTHNTKAHDTKSKAATDPKKSK